MMKKKLLYILLFLNLQNITFCMQNDNHNQVRRMDKIFEIAVPLIIYTVTIYSVDKAGNFLLPKKAIYQPTFTNKPFDTIKMHRPLLYQNNLQTMDCDIKKECCLEWIELPSK